MNNVDQQYLDLCQHILDNGNQKGDRTGTGTLSVFGYQMRFDLSEGFPLLTTKRVPFRLVATELLWFLSGSTNVYDLLKQNNDIWLPDAFRFYKERGGTEFKTADEFKKVVLEHPAPPYLGDLGPVYGRQWRFWKGRDEYVDQIQNVIDEIKSNPDSRRLLVTAWNVGELSYMGLPPCHYAFQFYVANGKLSCMFNMRSNDVFLGLPFNIGSYALLTHMVAQVCDLEVGELIYTGADVHIYNNHIEQVKEQLKRKPRSLPELRINPAIKNIDDFTMDDFEIVGYNPHPAIKGEVSVG